MHSKECIVGDVDKCCHNVAYRVATYFLANDESQQYAALEECMGEHDRVWSKCQSEVKELRKCNNEQQARKATDTDEQ